jgi:hypothetical protein
VRLLKKRASALVLILALFSSTAAIALLVNEGKADPFPPPTTEITLESPQNKSYTANTIALVFSAESISFFPHLHFYYSLDGQERTPVENVTIVSDESIPINPGIYMKNVKGNCIVGNLAEGWHNVTVYEISHVGDDPQNEEIVYSATAQFMITIPPETIPATWIMAAVIVVAVVGVGLLVHFKKRQHQP